MVYLPSKRAVISSKNVLIKEDLILKDDITEETDLNFDYDNIVETLEEFEGASDDITKPISSINDEIPKKGNKSEKSPIDQSEGEETDFEDESDLFAQELP